MKNDEKDEIKILQKNIVSIQGVHEKKIINFELIYKDNYLFSQLLSNSYLFYL